MRKQSTKQRKEKQVILRKTFLALFTIGFLISSLRGSTEIAEEARTVQVTEKTDIQTVQIDEKLNIQKAALYTPEPSIHEVAACATDAPETDEETADDLPEEKTEVRLKLSQMMIMQSPGLQSFSLDEQLPEEETVYDTESESEEAAKEHVYSYEEKEMIAYVVFAEARGECFEGMVAVAQVVLNRFESGKFGKSVKRVVYARNQFAVSSRYNDISMQAVEYAITNRPYPKNMYFFQVSKRKKWRSFVYYRRIGNHSFYCSKN